jgi:predicted nucleic acid-binding protein
MKAVVNATPLISLALLGRLSLLNEMFDEVIVPRAVYAEVVQGGAGKPGADALAEADWLNVVSADVSLTIEPLLLGLDAGELEVLLLARQIEPDWVIIDERLARRVAFAMGLPVKGTLGILLAAVLAGLLSRQEALDDLQRLLARGIRIAPRWQQWFWTELGGESAEDRT